MGSDAMKAAKKAVKDILWDLHDRRGIGGELDAIRSEFPETYREIKRMMERKILEAFGHE